MPAPALSTSSSARRHLYWIDWLRFLAAFFVLLDHARACNWDGVKEYASWQGGSLGLGVFVSLFSLGKQAVVLFFVLSGWLVGGYAAERVLAGTFDAAGYAADRIARVYVPLIPALLLCLAMLRVLDCLIIPEQFVVCLFGLQNAVGIEHPRIDAPLWTLGYEIWFYVLAGCAAVACRRDSTDRQRLAGGLGAGLAVGVCVTLDPVYLTCWLAGVAGGWLRDRLAPAVRPWTAVAGTLVMAAGAAAYQIDKAILPPPSASVPLPHAGAAQLIVAGGALLLAASISSMAPRTRAGRWLERSGGWLAASSYTLYLVHYPVLAALRTSLFDPMSDEPDHPTAWRAVGWTAIAVVVSMVMYALFERQTPRVRRWLRARFAGSARAEQTAASGESRLATAQ